MTTKAQQPQAPLTALAFGFTVGLASLTYLAFVVTHLWAWFVTPAFGLAALSLPSAFGLALVFRALSGTTQAIRTDLPPLMRPLVGFITNTCFLAFGYVVHLFM